MNRAGELARDAINAVPRASGDEPKAMTLFCDIYDCSPRQRG